MSDTLLTALDRVEMLARSVRQELRLGNHELVRLDAMRLAKAAAEALYLVGKP